MHKQISGYIFRIVCATNIRTLKKKPGWVLGRETEVKMSNLQSFSPRIRVPLTRCWFFILYMGAPGHVGYITRLLCGGVLKV